MAAEGKWYFTKEQLENTPSRKCGIDADKELSNRQQAANFIQDMGQRIQVTQLCINTAIVYMHRFYMFHSFTHFHRNAIAAAALFLAAKVEEQPRKLEHVIKVAYLCLHRDQPPLDTKSDQYLEQAQELVMNENILLQTLGFDVAIDHPHSHVVTCCQLVGASKDLAQTSYFMASNSLHLTTMCLQYRPTIVACVCIHLACKWSNWEIRRSNQGKDWYYYVDKSVTLEQLEELTAEFLAIFNRCPSRLKKKIMTISANQTSLNQSPSGSHGDSESRRHRMPIDPTFDYLPTSATNSAFSVRHIQGHGDNKLGSSFVLPEDSHKKHRHEGMSTTQPGSEYRDLRDRERERREKEREKLAFNAGSQKNENHCHDPSSSTKPSRHDSQSHLPHPHPSVPSSKNRSREVPPGYVGAHNSADIRADDGRLQYPPDGGGHKHHGGGISDKPAAPPMPKDVRRHQALASGGASSHQYVDSNSSSTSGVSSRHHIPHPSVGTDSQKHHVSGYGDSRRPPVPSKADLPKQALPTLWAGSGDGSRSKDHREHSERTHADRTHHHRHHHDSVSKSSLVNDHRQNKLPDPHVSSEQAHQHRHRPLVPDATLSANVDHKVDWRKQPVGFGIKTEDSLAGGDVRDDIVHLRHDGNVPVKQEDSYLNKVETKPLRVTDELHRSNQEERLNIKQEEIFTPDQETKHRVSTSIDTHRVKQESISVKLEDPVSTKLEGKTSRSSASLGGHGHLLAKPSKRSSPHTPQPPVPVKSEPLHTPPSGDVRHERKPLPLPDHLSKSVPVTTCSSPLVALSSVRTKAQALSSVSLEVSKLTLDSHLSATTDNLSSPILSPLSDSDLQREFKTEPVTVPLLETPKKRSPTSNKEFQKQAVLSGHGSESVKRATVGQTCPTTPTTGSSSRRRTPVKSSSSKPTTPSTPTKSYAVSNLPPTPGSATNRSRSRTTSSSSEPELVPVLTKLEDMPEFHSIRDGAMGIKLPGRVPDIIQPFRDQKLQPVGEDMQPPQDTSSRTFREPRTRSESLSSSQHKSSPPPSSPSPVCLPHHTKEPTVVTPLQLSSVTLPERLPSAETVLTREREHHKSEKKKKKDKHKHKEKEKYRDEKKHKKKHKEKDKHKDREKHKTSSHNPSFDASVPVAALETSSVPIRITIPKEKISLAASSEVSGMDGGSPQSQGVTQTGSTVPRSSEGSGLKIKIPRERLKATDPPSGNGGLLTVNQTLPPPVVTGGGLKIKISRDVIGGGSGVTHFQAGKEQSTSTLPSRKRERERSPHGGESSSPKSTAPASVKMARHSHEHNGLDKRSQSRSYPNSSAPRGKVSQKLGPNNEYKGTPGWLQ